MLNPNGICFNVCFPLASGKVKANWRGSWLPLAAYGWITEEFKSWKFEHIFLFLGCALAPPNHYVAWPLKFNGTVSAWVLAIGRVRSRRILRCSAINRRIVKSNEQCYEPLRAMLRACWCNIQISAGPSLLPHVATILRPVLRATSNIRSLLPSSSTQNPTPHV
jgi:hypothetical protein